ncbi:hypothetical protein OS493_034847 [Desmophyllum pertusum]|uniref:Uncharacterized protein n=1 Tax=Desmophyllum pertusum TaxID=174260 RepID=A0A9W9ZW28_9CNID|nr:hypothetical protein OS493_034847 [Desmophyllum pertusum]
MAQKFLVTEDLLKELGLTEAKLTTTILEEEYGACRKHFLQYSVHPSPHISRECTTEYSPQVETSKMMESSLLKEKGAQESLAIPETSAQLLQAAGAHSPRYMTSTSSARFGSELTRGQGPREVTPKGGQTTSEPDPRIAGISETVVASQVPQAGGQGTSVVPIAAVHPQAEASGGLGVASSGNYDLPSAQEVLSHMSSELFKCIDPSNPEELNGYLKYMQDMRKVFIAHSPRYMTSTSSARFGSELTPEQGPREETPKGGPNEVTTRRRAL